MIDEMPQTRFTGIFIPSEILSIKELSFLEMILLSWIDALYSEKHGGCFASNAYLAEKLNSKENTISKAIVKLKKIGLIEQVSFDGRQRIIRSRVNAYVEYIQSRLGLESNADLDYNPSLGWRKIQPCVGEKSIENDSAHIDIESKEERKEEKERKKERKKGGKPPNPPRAPHVSTSDEEHKKLVEKFGEKKTNEAYRILSEWKDDTPKSKWKKSDYRSILRWVMNAISERERKQVGRANNNLPDHIKNQYDGRW